MVEKWLQDEISWGRLHRMKWLSEIDQVTLVIGRKMFEVRFSIVKKPKFGVQVRLPKDEYLWVRLMFKNTMFESVWWVI